MKNHKNLILGVAACGFAYLAGLFSDLGHPGQSTAFAAIATVLTFGLFLGKLLQEMGEY